MSDSSSLKTQTCQSDMSEVKPSLEIVPYEGPKGLPVVLGPVGMATTAAASTDGNPFWTERAKEEFALKAMRPASLPVLQDSDLLGGSPPADAATPDGFGSQVPLDDVRQDHMMRMVAEENSKLWQELSSMKALLFGQGTRGSVVGGVDDSVPKSCSPPMTSSQMPATVANGDRRLSDFDRRAEALGLHVREGPLARLSRGEDLGWSTRGGGQGDLSRLNMSSTSLLGALGGQFGESQQKTSGPRSWFGGLTDLFGGGGRDHGDRSGAAGCGDSMTSQASMFSFGPGAGGHCGSGGVVAGNGMGLEACAGSGHHGFVSADGLLQQNGFAVGGRPGQQDFFNVGGLPQQAFAGGGSLQLNGSLGAPQQNGSAGGVPVRNGLAGEGPLRQSGSVGGGLSQQSVFDGVSAGGGSGQQNGFAVGGLTQQNGGACGGVMDASMSTAQRNGLSHGGSSLNFGAGLGMEQVNGHQEAPPWLANLMSQQEAIRTVDLPSLPELGEAEVGPLVAGDWLASIGPLMKDLSPSSATWWMTVLKVAENHYGLWLQSDPLEKLKVCPTSPLEFGRAPWARIEQRGLTLLLKALPQDLRAEIVSSRQISSVQVVFKILTRYQPGGLGERQQLLRQLVDVKVPSSIGEIVTSLRSWKRWLVRCGELNLNPPDATLMVATLDKFSSGLAKLSAQSGFRLSATRAALRVDTCPTVASVISFGETLMAEAETIFHGGGGIPMTSKVKAVGGVHDGAKAQVSAGGGSKDDSRKSSDGPRTPCRYFVSDSGCKKGKACPFPHEWGSTNKYGRCWNCGSNQHRRADCPVKEPSGKPDHAPAAKKESSVVDVKKEKPQPATKKVDGGSSCEKSGAIEPVAQSSSAGEEAVKSTSKEGASSLVSEAAHLLRSLRPAAKTIRISSIEEAGVLHDGGERALLDGGATHVLRTAKSLEEFEAATPVKVDLAAGDITLRMLEDSRVLLSMEKVQTIIPLGKLMNMNYEVNWKKKEFALISPDGVEIATVLQDDCPTVSEEVAEQLIGELEDYAMEMNKRIRVLKSLHVEELDGKVAAWLRQLKEMFPQVPDEILARVVPYKPGGDGKDVPWNRRIRRSLERSPSIIVHMFSSTCSVALTRSFGISS